MPRNKNARLSTTPELHPTEDIVEREKDDTVTRIFNRFESEYDATQFQRSLGYVSVLVERQVDIHSFTVKDSEPPISMDVQTWVTSRGWTNLCAEPLCCLHMVREFYFRARIESRSPYKIISSVRGLDIEFTPRWIRDLFSLPEVDNPEFPYTTASAPDIHLVFSTLIGYTAQWATGFRLPSSCMTADYRILNKIVQAFIRQNSHPSEVRRSVALLMYAIGSGARIDIASDFCSSICSCLDDIRMAWEGRRSKGYPDLPFGSVISRFILRGGVPIGHGELIQRPELEAYDKSSWHQSLAQTPLRQSSSPSIIC